MDVILVGDCLTEMQKLPTGAASLCVTSPPYEDARTYGVGFKLKGQDWVDWMIPRVIEMCRVTDGLVFVNAAGKVRNFSYSPVVEWLVADLTRHHGIVCGPAPYVFHRCGISGSGGSHYHRRDWEPVYAFARPEALPPKWSDNTAFGHPPRWAPGGAMSYRLSSGARVNQWGGNIREDGRPTATERQANGETKRPKKKPSHRVVTCGKSRRANGEMKPKGYDMPAIANPGNVIRCKVGKGHMGDNLAHENEAPFPESLVERFIRWFCPPDGTTLDPFCGSGTTCAVARKLGRKFIGIDIRESQVEISKSRCAKHVTKELI